MRPYLMNPFDFVPLPPDGPLELPLEILENETRYEGYIEYSIELLTPLHITGSIQSNGTGESQHISKKTFLRDATNENMVIPASSVRGTITSFIEALTGSDLSTFTVGDEADEPYGENFNPADDKKNRPYGFKIQALDHPNNNARGRVNNHSGLYKYHITGTLPEGFGQKIRPDVAMFMFGYVNDLNENSAKRSRIKFEDILVQSKIETDIKTAWDLKGQSIIGGPNPRANTAWYFIPDSNLPKRRPVNHGRMYVWDVLADKIRGRKFYFHQYPEACFKHYEEFWLKKTEEEFAKKNEGFIDKMIKYDLECIKPSAQNKITEGRIFFNDLPSSILKLLIFALRPNNDIAHKLGGLKPFGFGSVRFKLDKLEYRPTDDIFAQPISNISDLNEIFNGPLVDEIAWNWLQRILHFPTEKEKDDFIFIYPFFRTFKRKAIKEWCENKGKQFQDYNLDKYDMGFANPELSFNDDDYPEPGKSKKLTMYFDEYQKKAINFGKVMAGLKKYDHKRTD